MEMDAARMQIAEMTRRYVCNGPRVRSECRPRVPHLWQTSMRQARRAARSSAHAAPRALSAQRPLSPDQSYLAVCYYSISYQEIVNCWYQLSLIIIVDCC